MTDQDAAFTPDWVSPPGDTIVDLIEERGWTQANLAARLGFSHKHVNQLIKGKVPLTEEAALRLGQVLGAGAGFWLAREARYRERMVHLESATRHAAWVPWLDELPVRELMNAGAIPKRRIDAGSRPGLVDECLRFFGVASPDEWRTHYVGMECTFRRSRAEQSDVGAISAWLRLGEREAEERDGPSYNRTGFQAALDEIRELTVELPEVFEPQVRALLRRAGVGLVLVPAIPRAHVSGVARWLSPRYPLIQLSLYGKTNDRFWFTFFHEAAHILLHAGDKSSVWLDDATSKPAAGRAEEEANAWAADQLIPPRDAPELARLVTKESVKAFAHRIGIHPGIVVGRLQHDRTISFKQMNDLKVSFRITAVSNA